MPSRPDIAQIRAAVELILTSAWERGDVVELRALYTNKATVSGYFDRKHVDNLINAAASLSGLGQGVYITLNPVLRDCLARSANRTTPFARHATRNEEITHRHWLLIDADPSRPGGISANDQEHELALDRTNTIRAALREKGWPDPAQADSGNGGHLLYRIDLPVDDGGLLQRVLKALHGEFGDTAVGVDLTVHSAAQISKLYGTFACKGSNVPDRPHRLARMLDVPSNISIVTRELLEAIATAPVATKTALAGAVLSNSSFNVVEYLRTHGIEVSKRKELDDGGTLWEWKPCPWRPNEPDGGPFIIQTADGRILAGCHHSKCNDKRWDDLRDVFEPGWREREGKKTSGKGPSVAQQIVALGAVDELFHTAEKEAYATIQGRQTCLVKGGDYRLILRGRIHTRSIVPTKGALDDAIGMLESKAIFEGPKNSVHVRTAGHDGKLYVDLCNDELEAVEISTDGWRILANPRPRFVRHPGMLPLPRPVEGGSVEQLRPFINVAEADWPLVVAWLMAAIRPTGPYPILLVNGEQGSCKSTTCRRLRSLVDPNGVALRDAPKNEQTLMIWAKNSHVIALDNLSSVTNDLSNAMCRLATGGGHSERTHYSNDSETLFSAIRPQMLNGIGDLATRSDFLDRALSIALPVVSKQNRKTEKELDEQFAQVHASILGALFTAASYGLKQLPEVEKLRLDLPRLADFANWIIAVEIALGWERGTFMRAMDRNEDAAHELAITSSPVADAIRKFVMDHSGYDGTCADLLEALNKETADAKKQSDEWPKNETWLSNRLHERAPNLRAAGIAVEFHDKARPKRVTLRILSNVQGFSGSGGLHSKPFQACYGDDLSVAGLAMEKLIRFWSAPPVAPVAMPSLSLESADGAQVITGQ